MPNDLPQSAPIVAAGGIVTRVSGGSKQILLVRRKRYRGEIGLPKGKVRDGEDPLRAAIREVGEETGFAVNIVDYAGSTHYHVAGRVKVVFYFLMTLSTDARAFKRDDREIEAAEWQPLRAARTMLSHRDDRDLVEALFGPRQQLTR